MVGFVEWVHAQQFGSDIAWGNMDEGINYVFEYLEPGEQYLAEIAVIQGMALRVYWATYGRYLGASHSTGTGVDAGVAEVEHQGVEYVDEPVHVLWYLGVDVLHYLADVLHCLHQHHHLLVVALAADAHVHVDGYRVHGMD